MSGTAPGRGSPMSDGLTIELALGSPAFTRFFGRRLQNLPELGSGLLSELVVDARKVPFHRLLAHEQLLGDLRIDQSFCSESRHPSFRGGESVGAHESEAARSRTGGAQLF